MATREEINDYLISHGWQGNNISCIGGYANYELRTWNTFKTNEEAFEWYKQHMNSIAGTAEAEWKGRHDAFSPEGAKAYGDNWN